MNKQTKKITHCLRAGVGLVMLWMLLAAGQPPAALTAPLSPGGHDLQLRWELPAYHLTPRMGADGRSYLALEVAGWQAGGEPGQPQLPSTGALIALPPQGQASLRVRVLDAEEVSLAQPLLPVGEPVAHSVDAARTTFGELRWAYDPAAYAVETFPAAPVVTLTEIGRMRGVRLARLTFNPFHYHPARARLEVALAVEIEVHFEGDKIERTVAAERDPLHNALRPLLLNPELLEAYPPRSTLPQLPLGNLPQQSAGAKFSLNAPGSYALPLNALQQAGIVGDPPDLDGVHLTHGGQELALRWDDAGQHFLFYAEPQPTRWADHEVYQVTHTATPGLRMASRSGAPGGLPAGMAQTELFAEENHHYNSNFAFPRDGDHWYWSYLEHSPSPDTSLESVTYTVALMSPDSGGASSTLTLWLQGNAQPAHQMTVAVNGQVVGETQWEGGISHTVTFTFQSTLLVPGDNSVSLSLSEPSGSSIDSVLSDAFSLRYPLAAVSGAQVSFWGETTPHAYTVGGWATEQLAVYDITDPDAAVVVTDFDVSAGTLHVGDGGTGGRRYFAASADAIVTVSTLEPVQTLAEPAGADYVVVAPEEFLPALQPLLMQRAAQGFSTFAAPLEAVYDVYGDGRMAPETIRAFVAHAYANWTPQPAYLILVGDGTWDPLNHLGTGSPTILPPYLAPVDPWLGEIPADNYYVAVDGTDILPDLALGRLPANSVAEVTAMVEKLLTYDNDPLQGDWNTRHLFVADDPDLAGDFHQFAADVAAFVPVTHTAISLYCPDGPGDDPSNPFCDHPETLTPMLINQWGHGALIVNWIGHSSFVQWEHGRLFHTDDVPELTNHRRLPVVLEMTCYTGHFAHPDPNLSSMDEVLVRSPGTGAVAAWGSAGESARTDHEPLHKAFYQAAFGGSPARLGDAVTAAKVAVAGGPGAYMVSAYHLFGDPALAFHLQVIPWPVQIYLPVVARNF